MNQFKLLNTTLVYLPDINSVMTVKNSDLGKAVEYVYAWKLKDILKKFFNKDYRRVRIESGAELKKFYTSSWKSKVKGDPDPAEIKTLKPSKYYVVDKKNPNYQMWREAYIKAPSIDDYNLDDETKDVWRDIVPSL